MRLEVGENLQVAHCDGGGSGSDSSIIEESIRNTETNGWNLCHGQQEEEQSVVACANILRAIGEDPNRMGFLKTPQVISNIFHSRGIFT